MKRMLIVGSNCGEARRGLRVYEVEEGTGALQERFCVEDAVDPIYFDRSADGRFLYVAEKTDCHGTREPGGVSVYRLDGERLERVQSIGCAPTPPCHVSLSPDGRTLVWAEYRNAWTGTFRVLPSGLLEGPVAAIHHTGHGPNPVRQEAAHCHFAKVTESGDEVFVCDLGIDTVAAYRLHPDATMTAEPENAMQVAPGGGPRHLVFHPNGRWAYLVLELGSAVIPLRREGRRLVPMSQPISMLPPDFAEATKAAAIRLSPDGTVLAASNRGHDSIAFYRLDPETGMPAPLSIQKLEGRFPRDFIFLPDGKTMVVAHKLCNEFATYAFDAETGSIRLLARSEPMEKPLCFLSC